MNTEDKLAWCERYGVQAELAFAVGRMHEIGLASYLNPTKTEDRYTHDLFTIFPADLKTVRTPLFKAEDLFGLDPQYTVTFNLKDALRYKSLYPNIVVIFDVMWDHPGCEMEIGGRQYRVEPMHETYAGFLPSIRSAIEKSGNHKIEYLRRRGDDSGNAKASFVFDVRYLHRVG